MSDASATKEDPKNTTGYRLARAAVILLGALLVIAFIMLVVGLVLRMTGHGPVARAETAEPTRFTLARGARIVSVDSQPGRVVLHVRSSEGDEVDIVDAQDGHLVAQIRAPSP